MVARRKTKVAFLKRALASRWISPVFCKLQEAAKHPCRSREYFALAERASNNSPFFPRHSLTLILPSSANTVSPDVPHHRGHANLNRMIQRQPPLALFPCQRQRTTDQPAADRPQALVPLVRLPIPLLVVFPPRSPPVLLPPQLPRLPGLWKLPGHLRLFHRLSHRC